MGKPSGPMRRRDLELLWFGYIFLPFALDNYLTCRLKLDMFSLARVRKTVSSRANSSSLTRVRGIGDDAVLRVGCGDGWFLPGIFFCFFEYIGDCGLVALQPRFYWCGGARWLVESERESVQCANLTGIVAVRVVSTLDFNPYISCVLPLVLSQWKRHTPHSTEASIWDHAR